MKKECPEHCLQFSSVFLVLASKEWNMQVMVDSVSVIQIGLIIQKHFVESRKVNPQRYDIVHISVFTLSPLLAQKMNMITFYEPDLPSSPLLRVLTWTFYYSFCTNILLLNQRPGHCY
jgi:hypothetical protein